MTSAPPAPATTLDTISVDGRPTSIQSLPWWRRPRRLRRQLVGTLVAIAFLSVALVSALNFIAAQSLLQDGTNEKLASIGEARSRSIASGIDRITSQVAAAAADLGVVDARVDLAAAYTELDEQLEPEQRDALESFYQSQVVEPLAEAGLPPVTIADVVPASPQAQFLQYHYVVADADQFDSRRTVNDAGDGSEYSAVHAGAHPTLTRLADSLGLGDLLIVSASTGEIVYSVDKRIDLGTDLRRGPLADSPLANTVVTSLSRLPVGSAVVVDQGIYIPGGGRPVVFAAAQMRQGTEVVGTLVGEIPIEALNRVATADGDWEAVGLESGESYVVNADRLLRSESREWLEDPERYLDRIDDEALAALIGAFGSPVGIQPVETAPVAEAFEGRVFVGNARNYLGERTFSYSTPIQVGGVGWVVVVDVPQGDARGPLVSYAVRLGIILAIVLPLAAAIGYVLADRLTSPIPPVVDAAFAVAAGDRDPDLPTHGRDEFGDLARQLNSMASDLATEEAELEEEYERTRQLLLTVLPPRIVRTDGMLETEGVEAQLATVIALDIEATESSVDVDSEALTTLLDRLRQSAEELAEASGVERIRAAVDRSLYVAGLGSADDGADTGLEFAQALRLRLRELTAEEGAPIAARVGLSTGPVATGVLARQGLTYGVWGEPVRRAMAIASLSQPDQILADDSTVISATADRWPVDRAVDVVALDGTPMDVYLVSSDHPAGE